MAIILEFSPASWNVIYIPICILILISLSPLEETCQGTVSKSRLIRRGNRGNIFQANSRGANCNCLSGEMGWICCSLFGGLIAVIYLQGSHMNILPQPQVSTHRLGNFILCTHPYLIPSTPLDSNQIHKITRVPWVDFLTEQSGTLYPKSADLVRPVLGGIDRHWSEQFKLPTEYGVLWTYIL